MVSVVVFGCQQATVHGALHYSDSLEGVVIGAAVDPGLGLVVGMKNTYDGFNTDTTGCEARYVEKVMKFFYLFFLTIFILDNSALAVDFDHYFNTESITTKPVHSDYDSEAAFVADSAVYGVPRECRWRDTYGLEGVPKTPRGNVSAFQLGSNLLKSSSGNWYAIDVTPRFGSYAFTDFLYINADDGSVSCGRTGMEQRGGSWSSGGKWYKTFDLVLKTKPSGIGASKTELVEKIASESETKATKFSNYFTMPKFDGWMLD